MWHGLRRGRPGAGSPTSRTRSRRSALASGRYGIVREYTGHVIGTADAHGSRPCPTTAGQAAGRCWPRGWRWPSSRCCVLGSADTRLLDDGWTVVTADGSLAAHFEHTVAITADGPWVLTAEDGGAAAGPSRRAGPRVPGRPRRAERREEGLMTDPTPDPGIGPGPGPHRERAARASRRRQADAEEFNERLDKVVRRQDHRRPGRADRRPARRSTCIRCRRRRCRATTPRRRPLPAVVRCSAR